MSDRDPFLEEEIPLAENRTLRLVLEHSHLLKNPDHGRAVDLVVIEGSVQVAIPTVGSAGLRSLAEFLDSAATQLERYRRDHLSRGDGNGPAGGGDGDGPPKG